jgi:hypothetical protein
MDNARKNNSRVREFDIFFCYSRNPEALLQLIISNPDGGIHNLDGILFEYGNINRLIPYLSINECTKPFNITPKYLGHIDHLNKSRKLEIEKKYNLTPGSISSQKSKVDILLIDTNNQPYYISFKDSSSVTKLGQISGKTVYRSAALEGGLDIVLPKEKIPAYIKYSDTALTREQFNKLGRQDIEFAYFKKHYPDEWQDKVDKKTTEIILQLKLFGKTLQKDVNSLLDFIGQTIAGNLIESSDFYLLLGSTSINFKNLKNKILTKSPQVIIEDHNTENKFSLIIGLKIDNTNYYLTKIEPSFEGAAANVSQTKGIIFHFQQYPNAGNHFKKLFIDIA